MTINRRLLALSAVSVLTGTLGVVVLNRAIAATDASTLIAQTTPQPDEQREGRRGHRGPDFAAAAAELGTTEAELKEALGLPAEPPTDENGRPIRGERPRLNIAGAAEQLGVTEEAIVEALGVPGCRQGDRAPAAQ